MNPLAPLEAIVRAIAKPFFEECFKAYRASLVVTKEQPDDAAKAATADMDRDIDVVVAGRVLDGGQSRRATERISGAPTGGGR